MPSTPKLGLHHVRVPVTDPWASRDWYNDVFGFISVLDLEEEYEVSGWSFDTKAV